MRWIEAWPGVVGCTLDHEHHGIVRVSVTVDNPRFNEIGLTNAMNRMLPAVAKVYLRIHRPEHGQPSEPTHPPGTLSDAELRKRIKALRGG